MKNVTPLVFLVVASLAATAIFASVFVYYPVTAAATPTKPPIYFSLGSNANQNDLFYGSGNKIAVTISDANTSLSINVHPTYQTNYYKNIANINNQDTQAYYFAVRVNSAATDTNLQSASLIIRSGSTTVATINLMQTGTSSWYSISGSSSLSLDLQVTYSAGTGSSYSTSPGSGFTASLQLIYSTTNSETAP
ncbi:MAG: hypothetical protein QW039_03315 [Fervidicoccaceae archaeon]